jgi:autotransporter-associated beta strand protein
MATRYWVGGSGTWDNSSTANWAATTGGASGASAPIAGDSVRFDSNSGTAAIVTVAATAVCADVSVNKSDITLQWSGNSTFSGAFTLTSGTLDFNSNSPTVLSLNAENSNARTLKGPGTLKLTASGTAIFSATTATGLTVTGDPIFEGIYAGAAGTRQIVAPTISSGGTEATAINFKISAGSDIISNSTTDRTYKDLDFTGFSGTVSQVPRRIFGSLTLSATLSVTASANSVTFCATSGTKTITTNGRTLDLPLVFDGVGGTWQFADALTLGSTRAFTITNGTVKLKDGTTNTVGSFATGAGTTQRFLQSAVAGSRATITDPSGTNTATYLTIQDIAATGGATWQAFLSSGNVDGGNNTGWDFNSLQTGRYMYNVRKSKRILP